MMTKFVFSCGLVLIATLLQAAPAVALDWDNGGSDIDWSTGDNWNPNIVGAPTASDDVVFTDVATVVNATTPTSIVDGNVTIKSLSFDHIADYHHVQIPVVGHFEIDNFGGAQKESRSNAA